MMAFLAALAPGAPRWSPPPTMAGRAGCPTDLTIQVMPPEQDDRLGRGAGLETEEVLRLLSTTPRPRRCATLPSDEEIGALVETWISEDGVVAAFVRRHVIDAGMTPGPDVDIALSKPARECSRLSSTMISSTASSTSPAS